MPESAVVTQTNAFRAALLRTEAAQMRAMVRQWATVERALQDGIAETLHQIDLLRLEGQIFGRYPDPYLQLDRYRTLLAQTRRELARYAEYAEAEIQQGIAANARAGVNQSTAQIEIMADGDPAVLGNFNRMSAPAVENMVALLQADAPVGRLLREAFPEAAVRMTDALVTGTALGWNPRKTAAAMVDGLQAGALQRALVIARTEQLRALRTASLTNMRQSRVTVKYMRIAAKSVRTCLACLVADGTVYEFESEFDEHPNGRCQIVPILAGREPPAFTHGRAWLEAQPATVQRQIMGTGAYNAWRDGAVTLDDLVTRHEHPVWGGSLGTRALRDVLGAEAARGYSGSAFYTQDNARAAAPAAARAGAADVNTVVTGQQTFLPFTESRWPTADSDALNRKAETWAATLTEDQWSAVRKWSKAWKPMQNEIAAGGELSRETKDLLSAVNTAPRVEGIVYRGINAGSSMTGRSTEDFLDKYRRGAGTVIEWDTLSSSTVDPAVGAEFGSTVFEIKTKTARYINPVSYYYGRPEDEFEALIMPNTKFRIVGVGKAPVEFLDGPRDRWLIQLEEIP